MWKKRLFLFITLLFCSAAILWQCSRIVALRREISAQKQQLQEIRQEIETLEEQWERELFAEKGQ